MTTSTSPHADLRAALMRTVPRRRVPLRITMDGMSVDAELRMFTLAERDAALTRAKAAVAARKREPTGMESTLHLLAATLVAPGTDDLLLTGHDVETLMDFPADAWIQDAGIALGKMLEGSQDVGKDSAASPSAT